MQIVNLSIFLYSRLLGTWPNTYTFTKAVSEKDIEALGSGLPIAIARPSVGKVLNSQFYYNELLKILIFQQIINL